MYLYFVCFLRLRQINGGRPIKIVEEISKYPNIKAVTYTLLAAFSQAYSENQGQKVEQKYLKEFYFGSEEITSKVEANGGVTTKEISIIKKKSNTLYRGKKKDALKAFQESIRHHLWRTRGC